MKIVNRKQFLAMPSNTLYSKYKPCCFDDIQIKMETLSNGLSDDWYYQDISSAIKNNGSGDFENILIQAEEKGHSIPVDLDCIMRDGCFDDDQLFAIWERADALALLHRVAECIPGYILE